MWAAFVWLLLSLLQYQPPVSAEVFEDTIINSNGWEYLHRFCFSATDECTGDRDEDPLECGAINIRMNIPAGSSAQIALYFADGVLKDTFNDFLGVYDSSKTCNEKLALADAVYQIGKCTSDNYKCAGSSTRTLDSHPGNKLNVLDGDGIVADEDRYDIKVPFVTSRDRWMFVAVANCDTSQECINSGFGQNCQGPIRMWYYALFTNGPEGDKWTRHFSADEIGVLELFITALVLQTILGLFTVNLCGALSSQHKFHHTVRIFAMSVFLQWIALVWALSVTDKFADNGWRRGHLILGYQYVFDIAEILLVLLCILLAKGWTIVRRKISASGRVKITLFITAYAMTDFIALAVGDQQNSSAKISYLYYSYAGTVLLVMRFALFIWFMHASYTTHRNFQSKHGFYSKFRPVFGMWLLSTPIIIAFGNLIDTNARYLYVTAFRCIAMFLAQVGLAILYNPNTQCNSSFPFHQNTADFMAMAKKRPPPARRNADDIEQGQDGSITGGAILKDSTNESFADTANQVNLKVQEFRELASSLLAQLQDLEDASDEYGQDLPVRSNGGGNSRRRGPPSRAPPPMHRGNGRGPPRGAPPPMRKRGGNPFDDEYDRGPGFGMGYNDEAPHQMNSLDRVLDDTIPHQRTSTNPRG